MTAVAIKRALVSVTDKSGVVDFCRALVDEFGVEVVSTGGTARALAEAGVSVTPVEAVTGFPEMMDGRVKTLHPKVHGGLLARRDVAAHMAAAREHDIVPIDLVVVNLYAFEATVAREGVSEAEAVENIDIGGPSMLRSAAKNFESVTVVTRPDAYDEILAEMRANGGATTRETRHALACEVFALTARYDGAIAGYLSGESPLRGDCPASPDAGDQETAPTESLPDATLMLSMEKVQDLRYGENPHQKAVFYRYMDALPYSLARARQIQGKELSYNNILDTDSAWSAVIEFTDTTCVIVKHTNPCGAASDNDPVAAYQKAWECDTVSAFGGIIAFNHPVTAAVIEAVFANKQFVEVMVAPAFEAGALELLATKPNLRVLETGGLISPSTTPRCAFRGVGGGVLVQDEDAVAEDPDSFTVASTVQPTEQQREDLLFAWKIAKSVKSNAIVVAKDRRLIGMGAGQPNRVHSARIAVEQAGECAQGAVAASDAFVPFPDTVEVLAAAGVSALIQPGGSIRDEEVLAVADAAGMAVVFTGVRHFRH